MNPLMEVPLPGDLDGLPVEVASSASEGVVSVTAWANDGDAVTLFWDDLAGSVAVRWLQGTDERLTLEREAAQKVSVREGSGDIQFWVWFGVGGFGGQLVVYVGEEVRVTDTILRT